MTDTTDDPKSKIQNPKSFDPIQAEVWRHLLASIAEEMGATLERAAYSPNIKDRLDHSCAVFDAQGRLLAQAAHIPVHLGAMPLMLDSLRASLAFPDGVMWLCNDPRNGGTHLPDLTLVAPVYAEREQRTGNRKQEMPASLEVSENSQQENVLPYPLPPTPHTLLGYVACRAHHADIGGISPGSLPLSTSMFQEGLILPPVKLVENDAVKEEIVNLVCANSRTPDERRGDLAAQIAANRTGIKRLQELVTQKGREEFERRAEENIEWTAQAVRNTLKKLPPGTYAATDVLDSDGAGQTDIPITAQITIRAEGTATFDFTGSAPQVSGSLNATEAITRSACYYIIRCLVEEEIATNAGCFAPIEVIAPLGTVVNARYPAAVAGGNVETSQRITDVLIRALSLAAPDLMPAASQGTMNNLTIGGWDSVRGKPFAYYETMAGGAGASASGNGSDAIHSHMTNTRNTPAESLESHYPLRLLRYAIADGTGGAGEFHGGAGLIREIELLSDAQISLLAERRIHAPFGANGGGNGATGADTLQSPGEEIKNISGKFSANCPSSFVIQVQTPGGGGFGSAKKGTFAPV